MKRRLVVFEVNTPQIKIQRLIMYSCHICGDIKHKIKYYLKYNDMKNMFKNKGMNVATPLWVKCEDETQKSKSGNLESSGTPKNSELDCRGQKTSHWGVIYTIGKVLKCRCPKWPRMSHLDICGPSYGQKKGWESNWQFDSRPLKVGNRPESDACRMSATWHWKALKESYKIASDLILIRGLSEKLWMPKVPGVQTGTISGLLLGSLGKKCHSDVASAASCKEYYKGEGGGFPRVRAVVNQVSPRFPVACPNTKRVLNEF
jgi:hypothetical protein